MVNFDAAILTTFAVYFAAMIAIGIWVYSRTRTFSDFALGGRKLNAPTAALSAQASDMSGWPVRVKADETVAHFDLMNASGVGLLIQAVVGSFGGAGFWCRNRAGLAV